MSRYNDLLRWYFRNGPQKYPGATEKYFLDFIRALRADPTSVTEHETEITIISEQISDIDTHIANHTDVSANTAARHTQNTDTHLAQGTDDEISSQTLRNHVDNETIHKAIIFDNDLGNYLI